jgi:hypothetical protein
MFFAEAADGHNRLSCYIFLNNLPTSADVLLNVTYQILGDS